MFRPSTNVLAFGAGGVERTRITSSGVLEHHGNVLIDGSNGADGIDFKRPTDSATMQGISVPDYNTLKIGGGNQGQVSIFAHTTEVLRCSSNGAATFYGSLSATSLSVDSLSMNGTSISSTGNLTLDVAGYIVLDADTNGQIRIKDGGSEFGRISKSSSDLRIESRVTDADIVFVGDEDGEGEITALRLDMSALGAAIFNNNVTAYSDRRLKDNIETLDSQKTYEMRGVSYTRDGVPGSGVIAQEMEEVAPELVLTGDDGMKSVDYGRTIGYLIETIKDLKKEVDGLKNEIKTLREDT
jgi:hypothetical protein